MNLTVQHPVVDWYLGFDDLWELMRVNWHGHNPFTQSGMWDAEGYVILGIPLVIDTQPYRAACLQVVNGEEYDYLTIVTYGPKCVECGYTPYNAFWYGGDDREGALSAAVTAYTASVENAAANGIERQHLDDCSHLTYDQSEQDDEAPTDA